MPKLSKQLALSGQLKPAIRLGLALSEFEQTLDPQRRKAFQQERAASASTSASASVSSHHPPRTGDFIRVTEEINQAGLQHDHLFPPRFATRLGAFFSRLQTFAAVGDALIGGSQNLIASGVWGAVRFCLLGAVSFLGYFEKLSTLFLRLGTSWSLHERFADLFPRSDVLQDYLCEYLIVVVGLCVKVVMFTKKNSASKFFATLGTSFEDEFSPIQKEMDQWGYIIQKQAENLAIKSNIAQGERSLDMLSSLSSHVSTEARKARAEAFNYQVIHYLSPNQSQYESAWRRQRAKGTCKWIFEHASFKTWSLTTSSATLVLEGKLGSGKTVAMANLVTHMHTTRKTPIAYFFCAFKESDSQMAVNIVRSIAYHIIDSMRRVDMTWHSMHTNSIFPSLASPDGIVEFLLQLMPKNQQYTIILDELEACPAEEIDEVFHSLRRLMNERLVHLCYSARTKSRFQKFQARLPPQTFSVSLDEAAHHREIEAYIQQEIARRNVDGGLEAELVSLAIRQLVAGSQGMYLWVSLQLDSIFPQNSATIVTNSRIFDLLMDLPQDLPGAFERALGSITDRTYATRIFKLVMAAETPLTVDELRVALTITPGEPIWNSERVPRDGLRLLALCGGDLIEVDEEDGRIRVIHHSVVQHLQTPSSDRNTQMYHCSHEDSQNYAGCVCVTYLNLPLFDSRLIKTKMLEGNSVVERVKASVREDPSRLMRLAKHIKLPKTASKDDYKLDLGRLMLEAQAIHIRPDSGLDALCFQDYVIDHWLTHTQFFKSDNQSSNGCWSLWRRLVLGQVQKVTLPFADPEDNKMPAMLWAVERSHCALFLFLLTHDNAVHGLRLAYKDLRELVSELSQTPNIHGEWLGNIVAQLAKAAVYVYRTNSLLRDDTMSIEHQLKSLVESGASPIVAHHLTGEKPLEVILQGYAQYHDLMNHTPYGPMGQPYKDGMHIVFNLLQLPHVQDALSENWVPPCLVRLIERYIVSMAELLVEYGANCHVEPPGDSPLGAVILSGHEELVRKILESTGRDKADPAKSWYNSKPVLELALDEQNASITSLLCSSPGTLSGTTSRNTSFLMMAAQTMNDGWVGFLLDQVPQDQNASTVFQPGGCLEPLKLTVRTNKTRPSIRLMSHCADLPGTMAEKLSGSAVARQNLILRARVAEYDQERPVRDDPGAVFGPSQPARDTALLLATKLLQTNFDKMLGRDDVARYFGSPFYESIHRRTMMELSWRIEVCFIIQLLMQCATLEYLNTPDSHGNTALHYLSHCFLGDEKTRLYVGDEVLLLLAQTIDLLLSLGAKSNMANPQGYCPWWIGMASSTSTNRQRPWMQEFDPEGSTHPGSLPVNTQDEEGNTILHQLVSSRMDQESRIKNMLREVADPNMTNIKGETPLRIAVRRGLSTSGVIEPLLQAGADPYAELPNDPEGTIMDVAIALRQFHEDEDGGGLESQKTVDILEHYMSER